jgi:hypothetical protein
MTKEQKQAIRAKALRVLSKGKYTPEVVKKARNK